MNKSLVNLDYQIVHTTPGRIRINFPQLKNDSECAPQIEQLLNSLDFVVRVRLNTAAASIAIRYEANGISTQAVVEQIANCFRQVVSKNIHLQNQKYFKAPHVKLNKAEAEEELVGKMGGEVVGEIVGGVVGELLLGPIGATIASEVMGLAGGLIGESLNREVADVMGLLQHLEYQETKKIAPPANHQVHQPQPSGLTASHLAKLWQTEISAITAQADKGVMAFECWSQEMYNIRWTFVLSEPANSNSEKLFFPT